jgi:uncharacterized peroxidase-related enzyme
MSRLNHVEIADAQGETKELLETIQKQFGMVPNFMKVFANSPATLAGFLGLNNNLHRGELDAGTRERIALALAEENGCQYCVSAHTALGKQAGLDESEIRAAREGGSAEPRADAAVKFAQAILDNKGDITTGELNAVREAGYDDGEIVELIGHIGLNVLTNFFAKAARIDIDFPEVQLLAAAEA